MPGVGPRSGRDVVAQRRAAVQQAIERRRALEASKQASGERRRGAENGRGAAPATSAASERPTAPDFTAGETVRHTIFGEGTVISSRLVEADEEVVVAFAGRGVKKMLQSIARLEHVR